MKIITETISSSSIYQKGYRRIMDDPDILGLSPGLTVKEFGRALFGSPDVYLSSLSIEYAAEYLTGAWSAYYDRSAALKKVRGTGGKNYV